MSAPPNSSGNGDAVQTELTHFRPELAWKTVVAVDLCRQRGDFIVCECACAIAQCCDFRAEIGIENGGEVQTHRVSSSGRQAVPLSVAGTSSAPATLDLRRVTSGEGGGTAHECLNGEIDWMRDTPGTVVRKSRSS